MKRHATALLASAVLLAAASAPDLAALAGGPDANAAPAPGEPSIEEMRAGSDRYRDVQVALAEGYIRDPGDVCETADMIGQPAALGAMGIHFFRPDLLGISGPPNPKVDGTGIHTDFARPAVLIYEPQADGGLELVAVENLVFQAAWKAAGNDAPPSFHGVPWNAMADDPATALDEAHGFMPHFDRHVWIYRENPNGVFAQFNPQVSCAAHGVGHMGGMTASPAPKS